MPLPQRPGQHRLRHAHAHPHRRRANPRRRHRLHLRRRHDRPVRQRPGPTKGPRAKCPDDLHAGPLRGRHSATRDFAACWSPSNLQPARPSPSSASTSPAQPSKAAPTTPMTASNNNDQARIEDRDWGLGKPSGLNLGVYGCHSFIPQGVIAGSGYKKCITRALH